MKLLSEPKQNPNYESYYSCQANLDEKEIQFSFDTDNISLEDLKSRTIKVMKKWDLLKAKAHKAICEELLKTFNEEWSCWSDGNGKEHSRPKLNEVEFIDLLKLEFMSITDSTISLQYNDNDLFWGHSVCLDLDYSIENEDTNFSNFYASLFG